MLKLGKTMFHQASSGIEGDRRSIHTIKLSFWPSNWPHRQRHGRVSRPYEGHGLGTWAYAQGM
ncbi:hypothetical protein F383_02591 [Gossypium arboreum]|uniref:Uncharacterized protein n=1 Tax=Gossypium arboreum TaxID=29729 RepID=A0A0B0NV04_GOSAR|nr:hypothetical protein F383_02591 [Gossypium arboreum]